MAAANGIKVHIYGDYDNKDIDKAIRDLNRLKDDSGATKGPLDGVSGALKGIAISAAAAISIGTVVDFMKDAITQGSALEESLSKVGVVFGQSASEIEAWASDSAKSFGQSKQSALEAVGTFGNLFQAFGVGQSEAKDMSKSLVELAADLASFNNTSVEDAIIALRSGLSGETEPLKRYGVAINDARLKHEALARGLYDGAGALDANAKSQAAYALIMKDTTLAQGDFQRTAGGFANTMRTLQAEAENAKATIGVALVNAIQLVTKAMGGTDSAASMMQSFAAQTADLVLGVGVITAKLAELLPEVDATGDAAERAAVKYTGFMDAVRGGAGNALASGGGPSAWIAGLVEGVSYLGDSAEYAQQKIQDTAEATSALYAGYKANSDKAHSAHVAMAAAAEDEADALKRVGDEAKRLQGILSSSQSVDDFRKSLADLDVTLKGNIRTFKGMSDGAKENRDELRSALGDASAIAQKWVEDGKISADQYQAAYRGLAKKAVNQFVADGFKRKDIEAFLGGEGIWTGTIKGTLSATEKAALAAARSAGQGIGEDLAAGVAQGIRLQAAKAAQQTRILVQEAEAAGRAAAESNSPSKLFARMGEDLSAGLAMGIAAKAYVAIKSSTDMMKNISEQAGKAAMSSWDATIEDLKGKLDEAKQVFDDFKTTVSSSIMEALDFKAIAPAVNKDGEAVGGSFMDGLRAQAQLAKDFAERIKQLIIMGLSKEALQPLLNVSAGAGIKIADEIIAGGATTITETNDLVASAQGAADEVGLLAANSFYGAGVTSAQNTYDGFKANFGPGGPARIALENLMDRLARSLDRTSTITIKTVYEAAGIAGKRAAGGPVSAGQAYLVGEQGPEVLVMGPQSGTIIPNGALGSSGGGGGSIGGGNSYTINVNTGVGDPRQIGQQIVELITRYERANSPVFARAS